MQWSAGFIFSSKEQKKEGKFDLESWDKFL